MSSPRVLIGGFYGAANIGDEMILSVFARWLQEAGAEPVVISLNPGYTRESLGVDAVDFGELPEIADAAAACDLFVLGGGGLFQDHHQLDLSSLYRFPAATVSQYVQLALVAAQYGLPTAVLAQGVGPLRSGQARDVVSDVFTRATYASVRDHGSAALLREIGVTRDVLVAPDPGWCYQPAPADWALDERFPTLRGKRVVAAVVREWTFNGAWEEPFAQAMREALGPNDAIIWIGFQRQAGDAAVSTDDATIDRLIAAIGPHIAHVRWANATLEDVAQLFQQRIAGVVAMRLHGLLLALRAGVPALSLEYDDKMRFLGDATGLPAASRVPLDAVASRAPAALEALLVSSPRVSTEIVNDLAQQALKHRELLTRAIANSYTATGRSRWRSNDFDWLGAWRQGAIGARERRIQRLTDQLTEATAERDRLRSLFSQSSDQLTEATAERDRLRSLFLQSTERTQALEASLAVATTRLSEDRTQIERLEEALNTQIYANRLAEERYQGLITSRSWRLTRPLRAAGDAARVLKRVTRRSMEVAHEGGIAAVRRKGMLKVRSAQSRHFGVDERIAEYERIVAQYPDRPIVVFRPVVDWDLPLFQRPHHIARELARQGFLYFFCSPNLGRDAVFGFREIEPGLVLTNQYSLLLQHGSKKTWHVYSTDTTCDVPFRETRLARGDSLLYEYIDELHADISGVIPPEAHLRHRTFLEDERIALVTSADKLAADARKVRRRNHVLVTNGVDVEHFSLRRGECPVPAELGAIVGRGKPIVGYFGALAKWFDYELVMELALARPDLEVLLIGWNYDGSKERFDWTSIPNVSILGPIQYEELPRYACWFDVCMIPFLLNEITESTSPIKLFEYMAMRRPIVTTDMPECRKYQSTLVARDRVHFIERIGEALGKREDARYLATLEHEARRNSWAGKACEIGALLRMGSEYSSARLDEVQATIAAYYHEDDPSTVPLYERGYRAQERFYWFPVLRWIDGLRDVKSVADVGGAYGTLLLYAKRTLGVTKTLLVDAVRYASPSMLRAENVDYILRDFERKDVSDLGQFDLVLFTETIEHLNFHPLSTLLKLRACVAPGGHVIVTTPDAEEWGRVTSYYPALDAIPPYTGQDALWVDGHVWQYTKAELDALLDDAGFEMIAFAFARGVMGRHLCYLLRAS
jgi:teichuronic acid biosynthesis glycosyltransferase TuaH